MVTQVVLPAASSSKDTIPAAISLSSKFAIRSQDHRLEQRPESSDTPPTPSLGVLESFSGTFAGTGFNLIFRPNSGPPTTTTFPNPINPPAPAPPSENVLELNLTTETLSFSNALGSIPNRGLEGQNDIFLNGVPYVQAINDVSNPITGKADGQPSGIHFEPGLWMHIPATSTDPVLGESLARMASIPHGTTINAQCLSPTTSISGPPTITPVDITPFVIATGKKVPFISQTASRTDTPRLPQDLTKFIEAGTITQAILDDPNTVLRDANKGKTITKTTFFTVSTAPSAPELGGGTANIAFLQGASTGTNGGPNASTVQMSATFWIEEVQHQIEVPVLQPGQAPLRIHVPSSHPNAQGPVFVINPPHEITKPRVIIVTSTQIQYSQTVFLNFAGLTWPHVSCATLVPTKELTVPTSVWN